jgi:hypothetical protein
MAYFCQRSLLKTDSHTWFKDESSGDKEETTVFLWQELHFRIDGAPWKTHRYVFQGAASTNT